MARLHPRHRAFRSLSLTPSPPEWLTKSFDLETLIAHPASVVALDVAGRIAWFNPAWVDFARGKEGATILTRFGVGASYFDGIGEPMRDDFARRLDRALSSNQPCTLDYDCSSDVSAALFHMRVLPVRDRGLLVEHSCIVRAPIAPTADAAIEGLLARASGLIRQCSNCRRVALPSGEWVWVPELVASTRPRNVTHGICGICVGFYWPDDDPSWFRRS